MATAQDSREAEQKKLNPLEAVEGFVSENKAKESGDGMNRVMESAQIIQGEVAGVMAEVMGGMEAPKEVMGERAREDKKGDGFKTGSQPQSDDSQTIVQQITSTIAKALPTQEIMIKKIRSAINRQIEAEQKKVEKLKKHLNNGSAQEFNASIAKIRRLKETVKSLYHNTLEAVKAVYFRYFDVTGSRKLMDES